MCSYKGVYCAPAPDDSYIKTVAGIDLNHANISGSLPEELGLLTDLALLHLNSNRFFGTIPSSFSHLKLLHEIDLELDALFLNNNFSCTLPKIIQNSPVSVLVLANNNFNGCFPPEIPKMGATLQEIILMNAGLKGCLPASIAQLKHATVFDVSYNDLTGTLP